MKLVLNKEDLRGNYFDNDDCPIYRSLKRNGFNVNSVGGTYVRINNNQIGLTDPSKARRDIAEARKRGLDEIVIELDVEKAVLENQAV